MIWIANCLVAVVAALHVYFLILEMFLWTKPLGLKTFATRSRRRQDRRCWPPIRACITASSPGLVWGLFHPNPGFAFQIRAFFLICVIVAGVYGAATVSRRILYVQAAPATRLDPALAGVGRPAPSRLHCQNRSATP
jgi:putative membrane protein